MKPRERPILFSAPMVRANRAGLKTQTRRLINPRHLGIMGGKRGDTDSCLELCPYGVPGDRLWVRETWGFNRSVRADFKPIGQRDLSGMDLLVATRYAADGDASVPRWRPSIHMPRWACRNIYEITEVRVQRLRDISEEDAKAEGPLFAMDEEQTVLHPELTEQRNTGCGACRGEPNGMPALCHDDLRGKGRPFACWYALLWDSINKDRGPWASNPWVWVVSYKPVTP